MSDEEMSLFAALDHVYWIWHEQYRDDPVTGPALEKVIGAAADYHYLSTRPRPCPERERIWSWRPPRRSWR